MQNADLPMGASVLITGAGPMGLLTLQLARRGGAARILVSEPDPARRALALRLGAEQAIDPREASLPQVVATFTHGRGVDAAFECAGLAGPLAECLRAVGQRGTVVMVGVNSKAARLELPLYDFHYRDLRLIGSYGGAGRAASGQPGVAGPARPGAPDQPPLRPGGHRPGVRGGPHGAGIQGAGRRRVPRAAWALN